MKLTLAFSWPGLAVFALPMLVNIAYCAFPPSEKPEASAKVPRWLELVEQVSRAAYLLAMTLLVSREPASARCVWLWLAAAFLALYHAAWLRYFLGGRKIALLNRALLFVPMPLAVYPVLYFLCAALWLHNLPAAGILLIFGATHLAVSLRSFQQKG